LHAVSVVELPWKRATPRASAAAAGLPSTVNANMISFTATPPDPFFTTAHAAVTPGKNVPHDSSEGTGSSISAMALCPVP